LGAAAYGGANPATFECFSDTARNLGACTAVGLALGLDDVRGAGGRAGGASLVVDADFTFDGSF
ncbi:MAG: hypothetical protein DRQ60_09460, partial [Gammaproteobacteria bacterium]